MPKSTSNTIRLQDPLGYRQGMNLDDIRSAYVKWDTRRILKRLIKRVERNYHFSTREAEQYVRHVLTDETGHKINYREQKCLLDRLAEFEKRMSS